LFAKLGLLRYNVNYLR